jgi:hypothetical protein
MSMMRRLTLTLTLATILGAVLAGSASAAFIRDARADYVNRTDAPIRLELRHADWSGDWWEPITIPAGATRKNVTLDRTSVQVRLPECGNAGIGVQNPVIGPAEVWVAKQYKDTAYAWTKSLWIDDTETYDRANLKVRITRDADSSDYEEFTVELLRCDAP